MGGTGRTGALPILEWLPGYRLAWLKADLIAGLTAGAVMVPEAMAYAGLAGVPAVVGLTTVPLPLFLYAVLGTSRTMVVGPDSATALISGVTVAAAASSGSAHPLLLSSALALLVGLLYTALGLLRMGWIADFIPMPVMRGFLQGLVWVTILSQIPTLLGIPGGGGNALERLSILLRQLPQTHPETALLGGASLALLLLVKAVRPRLPAALLTVLLSIVTVTVFGLESRGVELVGTLSTGWPAWSLPPVSAAQLRSILPGALAIVLLGYTESLAAARAGAETTGEEIDPNQELLSLGPANLAAGLSSGFIVVGSLSKTAVAMGAGARTQVSNLVNGGIVLLTLLVLLPVFRNLSHATLAAIVIEAMLGLADIRPLRMLWRVSRAECLIAAAAFLGVLLLGVLQGIALGVILSLALLIERTSHPGTAILGRIPGEQMYRSIARHPEASTTPGLLIFRLDSNLIFPTASYFRSQLLQAIAASEGHVRHVLVDGESINILDVTAIEMLARLQRELARQGIGLSFARLRDPLRDRMRRAGLEQQLGAAAFHERISDGVAAFRRQRRTPDPGPAGRLGR